MPCLATTPSIQTILQIKQMSIRYIKPLRTWAVVAVLHDEVSMHCYDGDLGIKAGKGLNTSPVWCCPPAPSRIQIWVCEGYAKIVATC